MRSKPYSRQIVHAPGSHPTPVASYIPLLELLRHFRSTAVLLRFITPFLPPTALYLGAANHGAKRSEIALLGARETSSVSR